MLNPAPGTADRDRRDREHDMPKLFLNENGGIIRSPDSPGLALMYDEACCCTPAITCGPCDSCALSTIQLIGLTCYDEYHFGPYPFFWEEVALTKSDSECSWIGHLHNSSDCYDYPGPYVYFAVNCVGHYVGEPAHWVFQGWQIGVSFGSTHPQLGLTDLFGATSPCPPPGTYDLHDHSTGGGIFFPPGITIKIT